MTSDYVESVGRTRTKRAFRIENVDCTPLVETFAIRLAGGGCEEGSSRADCWGTGRRVAGSFVDGVSGFRLRPHDDFRTSQYAPGLTSKEGMGRGWYPLTRNPTVTGTTGAQNNRASRLWPCHSPYLVYQSSERTRRSAQTRIPPLGQFGQTDAETFPPFRGYQSYPGKATAGNRSAQRFGKPRQSGLILTFTPVAKPSVAPSANDSARWSPLLIAITFHTRGVFGAHRSVIWHPS